MSKVRVMGVGSTVFNHSGTDPSLKHVSTFVVMYIHVFFCDELVIKKRRVTFKISKFWLGRLLSGSALASQM